MQRRTAQIALFVVCVLLGLMLMVQFRTQSKLAKYLAEAPADQTTIIGSLYESNLALRQEVDRLRLQAAEIEEHDLEGDQAAAMVAELEKLRLINGLKEASGPGVEVRITADLRAEDVLDLINELRNAGAEAIALNGERIVLSTPVVATSGGVMVNGVALRPPYLFQAIGNPETLDRALTRRGGLISFLRNTYPQAVITVEQRPLLLLPATHLTYQWRYARPAN